MRPRRSALAVAAALVAMFPATPITGASADQTTAPYVLRWYDDPEHPRAVEQRGELGLVYTPDLLRVLVARYPADAVPPRIAQAIRERTPIVVMWEFLPGPHDRPEPQRPYQLRIIERRRDRQESSRPLWNQQDAAGLQELDARLSTPVDGPVRGAGVAVMAAFPLDAFVPGRIVHLQSQSIQMENGMWTSANVYAGMDPPLMHALAR